MNTVTRMNVYVPKHIVHFESKTTNKLQVKRATLKLTIHMETKVSADVALIVNVLYKPDRTHKTAFSYNISLYGMYDDGYPVIDHPCYITDKVPELMQILHSRGIPFPYGAYLSSCENLNVIKYDKLAYPVPILDPVMALWSQDRTREVLVHVTTEFVAILKANNVVIGPSPCIVEEPSRPNDAEEPSRPNDAVEPPHPTRGAETKVATPAPLVANNRWATEPAVAAPKAASPKAALKAAAPKPVIAKTFLKKGSTVGFAPNAFSPSLVKHPLEKDQWMMRVMDTINSGQPANTAKNVDIIRMVLGDTTDSLSDCHIDNTLDCILEKLEFATFVPAAESRAPVAEYCAPEIHDDYAGSDCFIAVPSDTFDIFDMKCSDYRDLESPLSPSDEFICFNSKFG